MLALVLIPCWALAVPSKGVNKKKKNPTTKISSKSSQKINTQYKSRRSAREQGDVDVGVPTRAQTIGTTRSRDYSPAVTPRTSGYGVSETKPLMRVIPQRDGRFLLEPMSPKKPESPASRPSSHLQQDRSQAATPPRYNKFEPWNFSDLILTRAKGYYGTPYSMGGSLNTGSATDCSGFTQYIYQGFKIDLPRSSSEQAHVGKAVAYSMDFSKMLPGDLLFFSRGGRSVGHAGIYLGEGKMIHASTYRTGVTISDLRTPYYQNTFVVAKRVFEVKYPK
jgi:cell wall-associated NlpC family hydrolase